MVSKELITLTGDTSKTMRQKQVNCKSFLGDQDMQSLDFRRAVTKELDYREIQIKEVHGQGQIHIDKHMGEGAIGVMASGTRRQAKNIYR